MCLRLVEKDLRPCTVGYKAMFKGADGLTGVYRGSQYKRPMNKWLNEKNFRTDNEISHIVADNNSTYPTGWHVYHRKEDAISERKFCNGVAVRVIVREPIVVGVQGFVDRVTVAKKIKIVEVIA